ncbi:MAG: integrase [Ruminococcaceae bacterium]|nr:integrase [Oscillospiraceae bacterium]
MTERYVTMPVLEGFAAWLRSDEKSCNTVEKYVRDARIFAAYAGEREITKELVIDYKRELIERQYAPRSINSMLAALNSLLTFLGWTDCRVRTLRLQRQIYCPEERELSREEYVRLVQAARKRGDRRMEMVLQTLCGTGIRVSELPYITVEAVRRGQAEVRLKGKTRQVFLVRELQRQLLRYIEERGLRTGSVFVTCTGRPLSRSNIWRAMKRLCALAGVDERKVFPHNLRHLFARIFYRLERDIAKLADVLGHSSINTTRIYVVTTGQEHRRQMEHMHLIL